ncbi:MAG: CRR6 family NdhI maturation factor [Prochloraceae cyanobacterium]|nr:CRR6 family NdhI maturation factor [Prochloraceae cyanobacterium]
MSLTIALNTENINKLDLSPAKAVIDPLLESGTIVNREQQLKFDIDYTRDPTDPRELSEVPEIRLYFVRLDAYYPWLPFLLDWKSGELARYIAMLVPHQFNRTEGIQYNPEALEIFVMHKIFILSDWLQEIDAPSKSRLKSMAQTVGYEIDDSFLDMIK